MQAEQYEGEVTAVGESIGIVPDAAFFRAHPEFRGAVSITVSANGQVFLAAKKTPNVTMIGAGPQDWGSVKGTLTQSTTDGAFFVNPPLGEPVKCLFPAHLQEKMIAALGTAVELSGQLNYHEGAFSPCQIEVDDIATLAADASLPTLSSLIGMAPKATGGESAVTFIRKLRDGWQ